MSHESFWGAPDIWTCRGCPDGSPIDQDGFCPECRQTYRREYEEHLDNEVLTKYKLRCNTCHLWMTNHSHGTCNRCIEQVYRPTGLWCQDHGATAGRCQVCGDQMRLDGV